jgi:hypothetical protein
MRTHMRNGNKSHHEGTKVTKGSDVDIFKLLNFALPSTLLRACFVTFVVSV